MAKQIKLFKLSVEPEQFIDVPFNSEILWFGLVDELPTLGILIDNAYNTTLKRKFLIYTNDKEVSPRLNRTNYIGSFEHSKARLFVFEE